MSDESNQLEIQAGLRSIFSSHIQFLEQFFSKTFYPDLTDKETSRLSKLMIETYTRKRRR